jgi:nucleoside-triphosphatase THEP1
VNRRVAGSFSAAHNFLHGDGGAVVRLAYVTLQGRGRTDALIAAIAQQLQTDGLRLSGTVQSNIERPDRRKCDMDLMILPQGPAVRISEDRGDLARGCTLDSGALEQSVAEVQQRLSGSDILVVNKFGKREAEGKGLVPVIGDAVDLGIPVVALPLNPVHCALSGICCP